MKNLKSKLTLSYMFLAIVFIVSLLFVSNYILQESFQKYIIHSQEKKNEDLVSQIINKYGENGEEPSLDILESMGHSALAQGLVLMVTDNEGAELFCMSCTDDKMCDEMIHTMEENMASIYPNFEGEYVEKKYDIVKNDIKYGNVTIGYYGPFFYNDQDIQFIEVLNKAFVWVAILLFVIAVFLGLFMANHLTKPIQKVIDKTKQIEIGNFTDRITMVSNTNEIDQMIHSINHLAETLEWQQASKKRMASDYAHEFCTPLATLQSNLEAMIDGIWKPDKERLESCRAEILRLTRMVSDIDKIVRMESDSVILERTEFDLSEVVEQVARSYQTKIKEKGLVLRTQLIPCILQGDQDKMTQVIMNLLSNAVKYTDEGGIIAITIKKYKNEVALTVSDTGIGITEEDMPNIFEHLFRADKSRDRKTGGSGIGLSVVKAIVDAHGGSVSVKSEFGKGSEFTVILFTP